jgi:hypothetical protein
MKCKDIDILEHIEGRASKEAEFHIEGCRNCKERSGKLLGFTKMVTVHYAKGKELENELNKKLQSIEIAKMKKLPSAIVQKVTGLREKSLTSKIQKVIGIGKKNAKAFFEDIMSPQMHAIPASPKDITKPKKKKIKKTVK